MLTEGRTANKAADCHRQYFLRLRLRNLEDRKLNLQRKTQLSTLTAEADYERPLGNFD